MPTNHLSQNFILLLFYKQAHYDDDGDDNENEIVVYISINFVSLKENPTVILYKLNHTSIKKLFLGKTINLMRKDS